MARNVKFSFLRGGGSSLEVLYGKVSLTPTNLHTLSSTAVLPAPTTFDLVNGTALATNVAPTPAPVDGTIAWAYKVKITDNFGKSWEYLVGVPDGTTEINFNVLPRYSETRPPAFGVGPAGPAGQSATMAIGTTTSGPTPAVTNSGTSTDAVLDFTLPKGDKGDTGAAGSGVHLVGTKLGSALPDSYSSGVTLLTLGGTGVADGWPTGFAQVVTDRREAGRSTQHLTNVTNTIQMSRTEQNNAWLPWRSTPFDDLATPLLNGVMPALDKAKLDGMTPAANSKTFAALASTYQAGFSVLQVRALDGWPILTTGTVVTQKNATGNTSTAQWLYSVEGGSPQYRVSDAVGNWSNFQSMARLQDLNGTTREVLAEDFGAVGNGTTDDTQALQDALNYAVDNGKKLLLRGGATYRTTSTLTNPLPTATKDVRITIGSYGAGKPTIKLVGNTNNPVMELSGVQVAVTSLSAEVKVLDRGWTAASTTGFVPGNLLAVKSAYPWHYDPRPESTDARKSELHKIDSVSNGIIYVASPAEEGYYRSTSEAVELFSLKPIKVDIENISFYRDLPAEGVEADGMRRVGLRINIADEPKLTNLSFYGMTASGIRLREGYNSLIRDCSVEASNNYFEGYGITVAGCAHTLVENCYIGTSRRGVDVSQGVYTVARHTVISKCVVTGGGRSSRGEWFGWDPVTGALASRQSGLGTHGAADFTSYLDNTIYTMTEMLACHGGNETIRGNTFIGKTNLACIGLASGGGYFIIENNVAVSGFLGTDKLAYLLNNRRPNQFVKVNTSWNANGNARLEIRNNYAEVQLQFVMFGQEFPAIAAIPKYVTVTGNRVGFTDGTTASGYLLYNPSDTLVASGPYWTIGTNDIKHDNNAGSAIVTRNINLNGAKVLNYATSGATT